jgi:hypothetical protein
MSFHAFTHAALPESTSTPIPHAHILLLDKFFRTVDTADPENGQTLADEVFVADGVWKSPFATFHGSKGMYTPEFHRKLQHRPPD